MTTQPESKLSREIKAMIRAGGGYCIKIHGGPTMEAGTPDLIACVPCVPYLGAAFQPSHPHNLIGRFVGIETKTPENRREDKDGAPIQKLRAAQIRHAGGMVVIPCRSVSEAREALDLIGWVRQPPYRPGRPVADD